MSLIPFLKPKKMPGTRILRLGEGDRAVFRVVIRGSIDSVWREITKTDELQKCMFKMRLDTDGLHPRLSSITTKHRSKCTL
jgi:hypothetical protein